MDNHENYREGLLNQQQENLRSLSALLAQPPGRVFSFRLRDTLSDNIETVQAALPIALLAQHPDLQGAEYRFAPVLQYRDHSEEFLSDAITW